MESDVICISSEDERNGETRPRKVTKEKEANWIPVRRYQLSKPIEGKSTNNGVNQLYPTNRLNSSNERKYDEKLKRNGALNGSSESINKNNETKVNISISQSSIFKTGEVSIVKRKSISSDNSDIQSPTRKRFKLLDDADISKNRISTDDKINKNEEKKINCENKKVNGENKINDVAKKVNNDISSKTVERDPSPIPGCSWFPEVEKPKLVIKEKKALYDDEFDLFSTFIETCLKRDSSNDMKEIVKKLKKRHERLNPSFLNSDRFKQILIDKQKLIDINDEKLYSHIGEVNDEMKSAARNNRSVEEMLLKNVVKEEIKIEKKTRNETNDSSLDIREDRRKKRKIHEINSRIEACKRKIKQLEEKDCDLDDESGSSYLIEDRYKRKLVQLWNALCKYTGEKEDAGRAYLRPKHISTTLIPQVDQAIMNFINSNINRQKELIKKGKSIADTIIFPDYFDILNCISQCNEKHNLSLSRAQQEIKAKEAFVKIGEHLKRARQRDYWDTFSLYLEEEDDDPALKDSELCAELENNGLIGTRKMNSIFEEFTEKQENKVTEQNNDETDSNDEDDMDEDNENRNNDEDEKDNDEIDTEVDEDTNKDEVDRNETGKNGLNEKNTEVKECDKNKKISDNLKKIGNDDQDREMSLINDTNDNDSINNTNLLTCTNDTIPQNNSSEAKDSTDSNVIDIDDESNVDKQPLLRLRSFAKPPTSWKDSQGEGSSSQVKRVIPTTPTVIRKFATSTPKVPVTTKSSPAIVDLTSEKKNESPSKILRKPLDPATLTSVKKKFKTVMLPSNFKGKQIISVKNITNNYNVVNGSGNSEIIPRVLTSVSHKLSDGSQTIIRIPSQTPSHLKPRVPVQMRVNKVPDKVVPMQILPKSIGNKQIIYQSNGKILNPMGKIVRVKTIVPNNDSKVMKVLSLNEAQLATIQKHRMAQRVALNSNSNQSNNQPQIKQGIAREDHQYSKKIVNNIVRIIKPTDKLHHIDQNKVVKKT